MAQRPIFLIGYMCSGKTTLGTALSYAAGIPFIDLDQEIERKAGMTVSEIFSRYGEGEFRRLESEALRHACSLSDVIVACGGGTPCREGAMELMNRYGVTVLLEPCRERLLSRLMDGRASRPKLASISSLEEMEKHTQAMLADRMPYYEKCAIRLDSSYLENPSEIASTVQKARQLLNL